jgi:hypothetical protein
VFAPRPCFSLSCACLPSPVLCSSCANVMCLLFNQEAVRRLFWEVSIVTARFLF